MCLRTMKGRLKDMDESLLKEKYEIEAIYRKPLPVRTYICEEVKGRSDGDAVIRFLAKNEISPADYIITMKKIEEDEKCTTNTYNE